MAVGTAGCVLAAKVLRNCPECWEEENVMVFFEHDYNLACRLNRGDLDRSLVFYGTVWVISQN